MGRVRVSSVLAFAAAACAARRCDLGAAVLARLAAVRAAGGCASCGLARPSSARGARGGIRVRLERGGCCRWLGRCVRAGFVAFGPLAGLALAAAGRFGVGACWPRAGALPGGGRRGRAGDGGGDRRRAVRRLLPPLGDGRGGARLGARPGTSCGAPPPSSRPGAPTDDALEAMRGAHGRRAWTRSWPPACFSGGPGRPRAPARDSARALEDQARLEDEVRAATAQARFTGADRGAAAARRRAPRGAGQPGWFAGLWSSFLTAWLVGIALVLQAVGRVLMNRMAASGGDAALAFVGAASGARRSPFCLPRRAADRSGTTMGPAGCGSLAALGNRLRPDGTPADLAAGSRRPEAGGLGIRR
jgi:hypothetical protein